MSIKTFRSRAQCGESNLGGVEGCDGDLTHAGGYIRLAVIRSLVLGVERSRVCEQF